MEKRFIFFLVAFFCFYRIVLAQNQHCFTTETMVSYQSLHPEYSKYLQKQETILQKFISENKGKITSELIQIPVVVHVLYNTDEENISDEFIFSQLDVLNQDYSYTNPDRNLIPIPFQSFAANSEISFCLASTDPNGNFTNGITRTFTEFTDFGNNDLMKSDATGGVNAWPSSKYLNIWVCDLATGILGYTYQPGVAPELDGVVIDYKHFGRNGDFGGNYNLGRTTTHEVGHWLNLFHTWGPEGGNASCLNDDLVEDTPLSPGPNYNCPVFPNNALGICQSTPYGDMFMNYMDYTYDNCMFFFTLGQKERMVATLNTSRNAIKTSVACMVGIVDQELSKKIQIFPNPAQTHVFLSVGSDLENSNIRFMITNALGQVKWEAESKRAPKDWIIDISQFVEGIYLVQGFTNRGSFQKRFVIE